MPGQMLTRRVTGPLTSPSMLVQVGTYVGNGGNPRTVTGVGFLPTVVWVKSATAQRAQCATNTMAGGSKSLSGSALSWNAAGFISALNNDGFVVTNDISVNELGTTYYWLAMAPGASNILNTFTYTGNGVDNRNITGAGFQPDLIFLLGQGSNPVEYRDSSAAYAGDQTNTLGNNSAGVANRIQAIQADGFQVGSSARTNEAGVVFHAIVMKTLALRADLRTFTGNSGDNRNFTGIGFQPDFVMIHEAASGIATGSVIRFREESGDNSLEVENIAEAANKIQAIAADGFQVGTNASVNLSGTVYSALSLKAG